MGMSLNFRWRSPSTDICLGLELHYTPFHTFRILTVVKFFRHSFKKKKKRETGSHSRARHFRIRNAEIVSLSAFT